MHRPAFKNDMPKKVKHFWGHIMIAGRFFIQTNDYQGILQPWLKNSSGIRFPKWKTNKITKGMSINGNEWK